MTDWLIVTIMILSFFLILVMAINGICWLLSLIYKLKKSVKEKHNSRKDKGKKAA